MASRRAYGQQGEQETGEHDAERHGGQLKLLAPQRSTRTIPIGDARRCVEVEAITGARQASFHQGAAAGVDAAQNAGLEELPQCPVVELESEIV